MRGALLLALVAATACGGPGHERGAGATMAARPRSEAAVEGPARGQDAEQIGCDRRSSLEYTLKVLL